ncbi:amidophosphoribosyltransferase [Desulfobotulus alkaliphilus]|uniref:Amidophosphoribosyltransferase n=1 Tax=Desulfobotulus alkaliphilus TaxID=622671 RepID=A0A562RT85_9BACT|nr:amidophosphoribosyltransferase [Desulfobotulus alkaliphilus]TWI72252.1 amidophosphoribosyltransferase [Desulfobotulus alkaliphilus]
MGGVFGVARKTDCVGDLFYGTDYLSHLGTKRGGMAVAGPAGFTRKIHSLESTYFRTQFEPDLGLFSGNMGIGVISDTDAQPMVFSSHLGRFALVTAGKIANIEALTKEAHQRRYAFSESSAGDVNPTEIIAMLISAEESFEAGILAVQEKVKGSCTFIILTEKGLYGCRDLLGRTPLILGEKEGSFVFSSESSAFVNLGYEPLMDLGPGEAVFINPMGWETRIPARDKMQICSFLWVYYGYPSSNYEGINVEAFRYRCGAAMGAKDTVPADFAAGIPDSGIGHAVGYANARGIPYQRPIVKYTPTWPRSFMPQNQKTRALVARMKLIPNRSLIEGKSMVLMDDSIVRGTQLSDNARVLRNYGAENVHMRVACPTLIFPCEFINFSTSRSSLELIGRKAILDLEGNETGNIHRYADAFDPKNAEMVAWIQKRMELTSLKFQTLEDLVTAIGLPKEKLCTHCWDGSSYGH